MAGNQNPDVGISIGVIDAAKTLQEIRAITDGMKSQLGDGVSAGATKATGALQSFRNEFPLLDKGVRLATNPLVIFTAAAVGIVGAFGSGVKAAAEFNNEFLQLKNLNLDKSAEQIGGVKQSILDLSLSSGRSAKEISKAFFDIQSGTGLFGEDVAAITSKVADFSTATGTDLTAATNGTIKAIRAFGLDVNDLDGFLASSFATVQVGITTFDELAKVQTEFAGSAAAAGQSVDQANKLFAVFTASAKDSAQAANLTKTAFQDLTKKSTVDGFKSIGVNVFDLNGKMRGVDEIISDLVPKLKDMSAQEFSVLKEEIGGSEGIRGLLDQAKSGGDALIDTFKAFDSSIGNFNLDTLLENAKGDFTTLKNIVGNQVNTVMIQLGEAILPIVAKAFNSLSQIIPKVVKFFQENAEVIKVVVAALASIGVAFAAYKSYVAIATAATKAYNIGMSATRLAADKLGEGIFGVIKHLRALTLALAANPFGLIAAGIALVAVAFVAFSGNAEIAASSASKYGESIRNLQSDTSGLIGATNALNKSVEEQIEGIKSGTVNKDSIIKQIDDQLKSARETAIKAGQEIEKAKQAALNSNQPGLVLSTDQIAAEAELALTKKIIDDLESQRLRINAANREFLTGAGLNVNSLAALGEASKKVNDELQKVEIGSNAFNKLAVSAKAAAEELTKSREELTLIQNQGGSVEEISNRLNVFTSRLNKLEFGKQFKDTADEVKRLNEELKIAKFRLDAYMETGGTVSNVESIGLLAPGPTQLNPLEQSSEELAKAYKPDEFTQSMADATAKVEGMKNVFKELFKSIKEGMKGIVLNSFATFSEELGRTIALGGKIKDVFKTFVRTIVVEAPKMMGMALLNSATQAPFPLSLALAVAGAALLGLSGFAAGSFEKADEANAARDNGLSATGSTGAANNAIQDLGTFSADQFGTGGGVQVYLDGKEISSIIKQRLDIENELQIGN